MSTKKSINTSALNFRTAQRANSGLLKDKFWEKASYKDKNTKAVLNCILKSDDVPEKYLNSVKIALKELRKK